MAELPTCFDPYLRYAIASDFKDFEFFDASNYKLSLLVEFRTVALARTFDTDMKSAIEFGPADLGAIYATIRAHKSVVTDPSTFPIWNKCVSRVELSLPVKPMPGPPEKLLRDRWAEGERKMGELLIGVLDDGCPFAAAQFLTASGTRVRGIWDQDPNRQPIAIGAGVFGQVPDDFKYGVEFLRDFAAPTPQIGLDQWIGLHRTTTGSVDEDGCYADAGFKPLKHRLSHGAHVMDVVAGSIPTSSRIGPSRLGQDRRDPPSFAAATDPASSAELVFVQFPEAGIRDGTGVWLKTYVVHGIQYILSFAEPNRTKKVIVNLSYGPTTGPHDGTAVLERVLDAFVTHYDGTQGKPKLEIVLPAGNAYLSKGHVASVGPSTTPPGRIEWIWRLPPDNTVLCFAEIWMSKNDASGVTVTLKSPSGLTSTSTTGPIPPPTGIPFPSFTGAYAPRARTWRLDDQRRWRWRARQGRCLCGPQRPKHGRTLGRQALPFCRSPVATNPVGRGQLQLRQWDVQYSRFVDRPPRHSQRDCHRPGRPRARCRWLHPFGSTEVVLFVGGPGARRPSRRSRFRAADRRIPRSSRHPCRGHQERRRVSPGWHQHRGAATGAILW